MKKLIGTLTLALVSMFSLPALAQSSLEKDPAYLPIDTAFDLKTIRPEVNINLPRFLLQDALSDFTGGSDDPLGKAGVNLADLIKDIKLIRLIVIEANETNRAALAKGVATLRSTLESKWMPIATVPEENVGIYALSDASGETMAGLALLVADEGDAVIANIVGRVSLGKVLKIASQMDKFIPKDLLQKLTEAANPEKKPQTDAKKPEAKN